MNFSSDGWTKCGDGCVGQEDERTTIGRYLFGNKLSNCDVETQLHRLADTIDSASNDQAVDIFWPLRRR